MRRSEQGWLAAGVLVGLVIAASLYGFREYLASRDASIPSVTEAARPAAPVDLQQQTADSSSSVELTDEEQKSIGVETVEVRRQTIRKEIAAPGIAD